MVQAVEASLKRLKTDYIDLYWMHVWDQMTPVDEVMRAFDDLVRQGKVLYVGISDAPAWWIAQANTMAELRGWSRFVGLQVEYNLLERAVERELLPMAKALGIGVTAWSPLASGLLTGKHMKGTEQDSRMSSEMMKGFKPKEDRHAAVIAAVVEMAKEMGISAAQLALAWLRHRSVPVIPIIGARKMQQFEDNLKSIEVKLSSDQVEKLDLVSAIDLGFPHDFYNLELVQGLVYAGMRSRLDV